MTTQFWTDKKVLITGGTGFIGTYVIEQLLTKGAKISTTSFHNESKNLAHIKDQVNVIQGNLLDLNFANKALENQDIVFHLASYKKNIDYHRQHPADILQLNTVLSTNVLEAAKNNNIERLLLMSSGIVYGPESKSPNKEEDGLLGEVEEAHYGYGWSKRYSEILAKAYAKQYGIKIAIARPYNIFGPRDNFNKESAQVIPALINRIMAHENPFLVWGDGNQQRSFLYVEDLARGIIDLTENYAECDPVNFGTDEVIYIKDLAKLIMKIVGEELEMKFDLEKPGGLPYRNCDNKKSFEKIGFKPEYSLEEGLRETIEWYKKNIQYQK